MSFIVDTDNLILENISFPDPLRAELGFYYSIDQDGNFSTKNFSSGKISRNFIDLGPDADDQRLRPEKRARIYINGSESEIRDYAQWEEFIRETIVTNQDFLDHKISITTPEVVRKKIVKNFHLPDYENATKVFPSHDRVSKSNIVLSVAKFFSLSLEFNK